MTIVGDGEQRRDYTHVSDVAEVNVRAAFTDNPDAVGELINVGTGKNHSVNELTELIGGEREHIPERPGEARETLADITKLKTLSQIFKERGGYEECGTIKGADLVGWTYEGPFDDFEAQREPGGYPIVNDDLKEKGVNSAELHQVVDPGKDRFGNDIVIAGEGTGIVHMAPGCGNIDHTIGKNLGLVNIAPLDDESKFIDKFGWLSGLSFFVTLICFIKFRQTFALFELKFLFKLIILFVYAFLGQFLFQKYPQTPHSYPQRGVLCMLRICMSCTLSYRSEGFAPTGIFLPWAQ
jgi:hypothetical protein